jgi:uncharacterized protein
MSDANVTTIRKAYAAVIRGDVPGLLAALAADVCWYQPDELTYEGTFRGPAEVVQFLRQLARTFHESHLELGEVLAAGPGQVLATGHQHVRLRQTTTDAGFAHVWTVRDGKVTAFRAYTDLGKLLALLARLPGVSIPEPAHHCPSP